MNYLLFTIDLETHLRDIASVNFERDWLQEGERASKFFASQGVLVVFFVDMAEIFFLTQNDMRMAGLVTGLLQQMHDDGHELNLHWHPQWLHRYCDGKRYIDRQSFETKVNFSCLWEYQEELKAAIKYLSKFNEVTAFRAGGYRISPKEINFGVLRNIGIKFDSSSQYDIEDITPVLKSVYGITEVPLINASNGFPRWDICNAGVNSVFYLMDYFDGLGGDKYFVCIGHTKQAIRYSEVLAMIKRFKIMPDVKNITFSDIHKMNLSNSGSINADISNKATNESI